MVKCYLQTTAKKYRMLVAQYEKHMVLSWTQCELKSQRSEWRHCSLDPTCQKWSVRVIQELEKYEEKAIITTRPLVWQRSWAVRREMKWVIGITNPHDSNGKGIAYIYLVIVLGQFYEFWTQLVFFLSYLASPI